MNREEVLNKLRRYCAYQERCTQEVEQKMGKLVMPPHWRKGLLEDLREEGMLDDSRYARLYASGKFRMKKWGRMKISQALMQKGMDSTIIDQALEALDEQEYREQLTELLKNKLNNTREDDPYILKNKVARYAAGKGYEAGLIWEVLKGL